MAPKQKTKQRGRPAESADARVKRREKDARLLLSAIERLNSSQNKIADKAKIPQRELNAVINKKRDLSREYIKRLTNNAGISADFLLGTTDEIGPIGSTRRKNEIEEDLRAFVWTALRQRGILPPKNSAVIDGEQLLKTVAAIAEEDAVLLASYHQRQATLVDSLHWTRAALKQQRDDTSNVARGLAEAVTDLERLLSAPPPSTRVLVPPERAARKDNRVPRSWRPAQDLSD